MGNKHRNRNTARRRNGKKENTPKWIVLVGGFATIVAIITALWGGGKDIYAWYKERNPVFAYETNFDWMSMEEVDTIISDESKVVVYAFEENDSFQGYWDGVALTALFSNLTDTDRVITSFTVYADNITVDLSPDLVYGPTGNSSDSIEQFFYNNGWGESGPIHISADRIERVEDNDVSCLQLSLSKDAQTTWVFESMQPGDWREFSFLTQDDFVIEESGQCDGNVLFCLYLDLFLPDTGHEEEIPILLEVSASKVRVYHDGLGGDIDTSYVVKIPTDGDTWVKKYPADQKLPAKKTVRLPIFIVPEKSCSLTIRVEFELSNGEIVKSEELVDTYIKVPYYDDWTEYLDGELLDWDSIDSFTDIYFPFESSSAVLP